MNIVVCNLPAIALFVIYFIVVMAMIVIAGGAVIICVTVVAIGIMCLQKYSFLIHMLSLASSIAKLFGNLS
jgi:hypothetical protein